jgi:hypothetical protein
MKTLVSLKNARLYGTLRKKHLYITLARYPYINMTIRNINILFMRNLGVVVSSNNKNWLTKITKTKKTLCMTSMCIGGGCHMINSLVTLNLITYSTWNTTIKILLSRIVCWNTNQEKVTWMVGFMFTSDNQTQICLRTNRLTTLYFTRLVEPRTHHSQELIFKLRRIWKLTK